MNEEENKENCFAYINDKVCGALSKKDCYLCSFYKFYLDEKDKKTKSLISETREEVNGVNKE
jgi:hypothetical protein|nr:MAG TPA_asm: hypothetical protein [Caudoviricetes sp.]